MPVFEIVVVAIAMAILAAIAVRLTWLAAKPLSRPGEVTLNRDGSFSMVCSICGSPADVAPGALASLSPAEKALAVREHPAVIGQNLVEFACPSCDASHCYSMQRHTMTLIGVNLYQGQHYQTNCKECQKHIIQPPWRQGAYDGKVEKAPGDVADMGLQCSLCGAICCVDCCKRSTRNRTTDGTLLCPRCFRGPIDRFYHEHQGAAVEPRSLRGY